MLQSTKINKKRVALGVLFFVLVQLPVYTIAKDYLSQEAFEAKRLQLVSGKSLILRSDKPIKRISIADPKVVDFTLLTSRQIYITGKTAGTTNLSLWKDGELAAIYDLEVTYDLSLLKRNLNQILPEEKDLRLRVFPGGHRKLSLDIHHRTFWPAKPANPFLAQESFLWAPP